MDIIDGEFKEFSKKHDGSRVLQALLKYGSANQREVVIKALKSEFVAMMNEKYSHHICLKILKFCPNQCKGDRREMIVQVLDKMSVLIMHMLASEIIDGLYQQASPEEKSEMVHAFYGKFFIVMQQGGYKSLKEMVENKPNLKTEILVHLESLIHKLIDKGLIRHQIVQAIIWDFFEVASTSQQNEIANLLQEKFPALLLSTEGLKVAVAMFMISSAKDRKKIVKQLKGNVKEMITNPIANKLLIAIISNYDDTVTCKKYIVNELVTNLEETIDDEEAQALYIGVFNPECKQVFSPQMMEAMNVFKDKSTSVKDPEAR